MDINPIYKFMKDNGLTQKDEATFVSEYSNPQKSAELHKFMTDNGLTTKGADDFYNEYFSASKKKGDTTQDSGQPTKPSAPSFGQKVTEKITNAATQVPFKTTQQSQPPAQEKKKAAPSKYFEVDITEPQDVTAEKPVVSPVEMERRQSMSMATPKKIAERETKQRADDDFYTNVASKEVFKMPTYFESKEYASDITGDYLNYLQQVDPEKGTYTNEKYKVLKAKSKEDRTATDEGFLRQVESEAVNKVYDANYERLQLLGSNIDNLEKIAVTPSDRSKLDYMYKEYEKVSDSLKGLSATYDQNNLQYGKIAGQEMQGEQDKRARFEKIQAGEGKTKEFFTAVADAAMEGILNTYQFPKVMGDLIGDKDYDWSDEFYDAMSGAKSTLDLDLGAPLPQGTSTSDLPFAARAALVGGNAIGTMGIFMLGGATGGATKLGQRAATFATSFLTQESNYYQEALDGGMSPQDAAITGSYLAAQMALFETIIPDIGYLNAAGFKKGVISGAMQAMKSGLPAKEATKLALKNALSALPENALTLSKNVVKSGGKEFFAEELPQNLAEDTAKEIINNRSQKAYFNDTFNVDGYVDAAIGSFVAAGGTSGLSSIFSKATPKSPVQEEVMRQIVERRDKIFEKGTASDKTAGTEGKKQVEEAGEILDAMKSHSGWNQMSKEEQDHAFAVAQQADVMKKEQERMKELRIPDDRKDAEIKRLEDEVNEMFSMQMEQDKQKAKDAKLKAIEDEFNKSMEGEEFPVQEDERDQEIVELQKQREERGIKELDTFFSDMKPMVPFAVERMEQGQPVAQSVKQSASNYLYKKYKELTDMKSDPSRMMTRQQIASVQKQLEQDIRTLEGTTETKAQVNDQENIQGISGEVGKGQEPVTTQPVEVPSEEAPATGGVLQAQEEVVAPSLSVGSKIQWNVFGNEESGEWTVGEKTKTRGGKEAVVLSKTYVESSKNGKSYTKEYADANGIKYDNERTVEHIVTIAELQAQEEVIPTTEAAPEVKTEEKPAAKTKEAPKEEPKAESDRRAARRKALQEEEAPAAETKTEEELANEDFAVGKIQQIKENGKPLSEFKEGDKVFWASDFDPRYKQYVEGTVTKKGGEFGIKRLKDNPLSKKHPVANFQANTLVVLKPEGESEYTGEETLWNKKRTKTEKAPETKPEPKTKKEPETKAPATKPTVNSKKIFPAKFTKENIGKIVGATVIMGTHMSGPMKIARVGEPFDLSDNPGYNDREDVTEAYTLFGEDQRGIRVFINDNGQLEDTHTFLDFGATLREITSETPISLSDLGSGNLIRSIKDGQEYEVLSSYSTSVTPTLISEIQNINTGEIVKVPNEKEPNYLFVAGKYKKKRKSKDKVELVETKTETKKEPATEKKTSKKPAVPSKIKEVPDKKGIPSKFTKDNIGELIGTTVVVNPQNGPMKVLEVKGPFDPYEGYATFNKKKGLTEEYYLIDEDQRATKVFINDKGELESSTNESVTTNDPNAKFILKEATEETPLSINKFKKGDIVKYVKDGQQYEVLKVDPQALSDIKNIQTGKVISVAYPANFLPSSKETAPETEPQAESERRASRRQKMQEEGGTKISEAAPSVRRAGAVEASESSNENAGIESALEGVGLNETTLDEWKEKNRTISKKPRIEELTQAVRALMSGKIKFKQYYEQAKKYMPSKLMEKVPTPATLKEIVGSVDKNKLKIGIINLNKFIKKGTKVGLRIDIPSFNRFGKYVVTVHDKRGSNPVIGYGSTGSIKNVNFKTSVSTAANIGAGEDKSAFAMAVGEWMDESPESIQARAEEALNSPEWVQVSMNPARNSFFFDKADGNPVIAADEVLQVGNLVLAKNPQKIDLNTKEGMAQFEKQFSAKTKEGVTYQYRKGQPESERRAARRMAMQPDIDKVIADIERGLSESGITVEVKDDADYNNDERVEAGQGRGSQGIFIADDGTIILNRDKIEGEWGKTIVFHEGTHPIINIIRNTDPKRYAQIIEGIKKEAERNPQMADVLKFAAGEEYTSEGEREDELAAETFARIASGKLDLMKLDKSLRDKIISFVNDILKALGLSTISINTPDQEFRKLAGQISDLFNNEGKLSEIVGAENVQRYENIILGKNGGQFSVSSENRTARNIIKDTDVDRPFDNSLIQYADVSEYDGKTAVGFLGDKQVVGNVVSPTGVELPGRGGGFFPVWANQKELSKLISGKIKEIANGSIWATTDEDGINRLMSALKKGNIAAIGAQAETGVLGNKMMLEHYANLLNKALEPYQDILKDSKSTPKQKNEANKFIQEFFDAVNNPLSTSFVTGVSLGEKLIGDREDTKIVKRELNQIDRDLASIDKALEKKKITPKDAAKAKKELNARRKEPQSKLDKIYKEGIRFNTIQELYDELYDSSYDVRSNYFAKVFNVGNSLKFNIPSVSGGATYKMDKTILEYANDPAFANAEYGDIVGFIEYDPESLYFEKTTETDDYHHKSYHYALKGTIKSIKYLNNLLDVRSIFYESKPVGTGEGINQTPFGLRERKSDAARGVMGSMPSAKITAAEVEAREAAFEAKRPSIAGQRSFGGREDIQNAYLDAMDAVDDAVDSGTSPAEAVADNVTSQDWYKSLSSQDKAQVDKMINNEFGEEIIKAPKAATKPKAPTGVAASISSIVDNYYKIKDGDRSAREAINEILDSDPKLKYIYLNIAKINKQLQDAGVITKKTDGCP